MLKLVEFHYGDPRKGANMAFRFLSLTLLGPKANIIIGCLTFIFYQKYFYDKMDLRLFYFNVTIRVSYNGNTHHR